MITWARLSGRHATGTAKPGPPDEPPPPPEAPRSPDWRRWLLPIGTLIVTLWLLVPLMLTGSEVRSYSYSDFVARVGAGQVKTVTIDDQGAVSGSLDNGTTFTTQIPTALNVGTLESQLQSHHVQIKATRADGSLLSILLGFLPMMLLIGLFLWMGRQAQHSMAGGLGGIGGFGRSGAKIIEAERPTTRFGDVAGYEGVKQEIDEVVDFLRDPGRYAAAGAKPPRGVIMVGPPGTGKTLLARAVAGEAAVPFLSVTGSGFVEMFVGVGASRVRDLFDEARKRAPSIVFIDEIDAIGGRRGRTVAGGNDEREQTLNQLLAEMDGFDQSSGIVVLAATNRPETLDTALLRPGRFDRQVTVPLPNQAERAAILAVHAAGKHLGPSVDLGRVARATPGFSGADLANLVNEAAINAVRVGRTTINADDLDAARDRVLLGRRETSNALLPQERHAVAVHESGHALLATLCEHADPVAKVTILPAGPTLGVTEQLPEAEGTSTARATWQTCWPYGSAAGRRNWSSSTRAPPVPRTTSRPPRRSPPAWCATSACHPRSARSATPPPDSSISARTARTRGSSRTPNGPSRSSTRRSPVCSARPRNARSTCCTCTAARSTGSPRS